LSLHDRIRQFANPSTKQHRVLVVDDHLDTAQSMAVVLREMGHEVQFAINGYAAIDIANKFRPEVVVVDMLLPDFHGSDLSRLLRMNAKPRSIRVIAVTGNRGEEVRERALAAGCDEFLLKPIEWKTVEQLLAKV
jgi:two-component system CheB/CheR fusion protein